MQQKGGRTARVPHSRCRSPFPDPSLGALTRDESTEYYERPPEYRGRIYLELTQVLS
jgi:hypothetical protein